MNHLSSESTDIPDGWGIYALNEVSASKKVHIDPQCHQSELFEYYSIPSFQSSGKPFLETGESILSQKLVVNSGTILFGKLNPRVPKVWQVQPNSTHRQISSTEFIPLVPNARRITSDFLYFLCMSDAIMKRATEIVSGSTPSRQRVDPGAFSKLRILLPPLAEQRAIAHVLRTVQQAKEATEAVIAATRELKRSLMQHLFTYGPVPVTEIDQVPLKETEIGLMPEHWEVTALGSTCHVRGGKRLPKGHQFSDAPTPHKYIRVTDFEDGTISMAGVKSLSHADHVTLSNYVIGSDDVYISIAGTIGVVGTVPSPLHLSHLTENAARISVINPCIMHRDFLMYFLSSERGGVQVESRTTRTSQPKLALTRIREISLPLPPIAEQYAIGAALSSFDEKIRAEQQRLACTSTLFDSLLHHLMTGKLRVNDLDLDALMDSTTAMADTARETNVAARA